MVGRRWNASNKSAASVVVNSRSTTRWIGFWSNTRTRTQAASQ